MNNTETEIKDKDKTVDQLILDNQNFVYSIVNKEFKKYPWDIKEELYSAGKLGLCIAAQKFNPKDYDNKFISYAVHWIRCYINEEIRKLYPVKLNQNYIYKRNKINKFVTKYKKNHNNEEPSDECISKELGLSKKVLENIKKVNGGENFSFVSFQAISENNDSDTKDSIENKLVNEYLESTESSDDYIKYQIKDLFEALKKQIPEKDYNMFYDLKVNGLSFSDLKNKYGLNFPSSAAYIIKRTEKICKKLLGE